MHPARPSQAWTWQNDKNIMQVAFLCGFRQGVSGMSRDLGRDVPDLEKLYPPVPKGRKHRVTNPGKPQKSRGPPQSPLEPSEKPCRALGETPQSLLRDPAEPSERQISSESLAEGCAPRMVTLRNFRALCKKSSPLMFRSLNNQLRMHVHEVGQS